MDERRFCCGCGLCSSDGIPPLSQSFSRLGIVRTEFGSALGLSKRFSKISFFSEIPARSPYFSIFLSVFARSGRLSKEVLVTTSLRTGCVCPRRAGNVRSRRPCGRVPGRCAAVRNWPSAKANGARQGDSWRIRKIIRRNSRFFIGSGGIRSGLRFFV